MSLVTAFRGIYLDKGIDISKLVKSWTDNNLPPLCIIETDDYIAIYLAGGQHRAKAAQIYGKELMYRVGVLKEKIEAKVGVSKQDPALRELIREMVECEGDLKKLRTWLVVWLDWSIKFQFYSYTKY